MNVSEAIDTVRSRATDANGNLKPEAELQRMIRKAADNGVMNFATGGLPKAVEGLMDSHFDGNATAMIEFLEEHERDFGNRDAVQFIESGGAAAYIVATRQNEALEATRVAAAQTPEGPRTPAEAPSRQAEAPQVAQAEPELATPGAGGGAVVAGGAAATAPVDPMAAADRVMAENQTREGTTNFLEMMRNLDMDQFDANGDGQVGFGEFLMGFIEMATGEEGAQQFRDMMGGENNMFSKLFGGEGTMTIGTPMAQQAGVDVGNAQQLDPSTGEPVVAPTTQPTPGSVTPTVTASMDPNDPNSPNYMGLGGPRAPGMQI